MDFQVGVSSFSSQKAEARKRSAPMVAETKRELLGRTIKNRKKLKSLTNKHLRVIAMHLSGDFKGIDIANHIGVSVTTVYGILNDPLAKSIIDDFKMGQITELSALYPKAVDAIRAGLAAGDVKTKLLAVDRYLKMSGVGNEEREKSVNVSITVNNAREAFVSTLKDMIDITPSHEDKNGRDLITSAGKELETSSS